MPEINSSLRGKPLRLEGGWLAPVPTVQAIDTSFRERAASYFQSQRHLAPMQAEDRVLETVQLTLDGAYRRVYVDNLRWFMRVYAQTYPHLWNQQEGDLAGFDPVALAGAIAPHEASSGRNGRAVVRNLMRRMAEAENAVRY